MFSFVSRETYDQAVATLQAALNAARSVADARQHTIDVQRGEIEYLRGQVGTLQDRVAEMRREGFDPPAKAPTVEPRTPREKLPPDVLAAIDGLVDPETPDHWSMQAEARRLLTELSPAEAIDELKRGATFNPHWL